MRQQKTKGKQKNTPPAAPMRFTTSDGFTVLVGRNNRQNDKLTLKDANNHDMWLHVKNIPGSHTIIVSNHREITEQAILEAAPVSYTHLDVYKRQDMDLPLHLTNLYFAPVSNILEVIFLFSEFPAL